MKYFKRGGGYYLDVGASSLIVDKKIKVKGGQEIQRFRKDGIEFADGDFLKADVVVLATGLSLEHPLLSLIDLTRVPKYEDDCCQVDLGRCGGQVQECLGS